MEVTINYNGQAVTVEVTLEVYEFLDRADHKTENLFHEQRRHWDGREFDEYIITTEGVGAYGETPEEYLCHMETLHELMAVLGAPVFPHGNLAFFVAIFSEMTRLSAGVGLRLHSIHPSITRESKWRYIMKKINLRELYPDVYITDFFVDVTEEVYKIEYYTIANQKQARYNIDKKTKATATVQKIDFGCFHKEQIENRYPQWLKTLVCSAWRKLFNKAKGRRNAAFLKHTS